MIELNSYNVKFEIVKPLIFTTWPGFYLRNALVKALSLNCRNSNRKKENIITNCHGCKFQSNCDYFALNLPVEEPLFKPNPMPFILHVDKLIIGKYENGTLSFQISLIGRVKDYVHLFEKAFSDIASKFGIGEKGVSGNIRFVSMITNHSDNNTSLIKLPSRGTNEISLYFRQLKLAEYMMNPPFDLGFEKFLSLIATRLDSLEKLYGNDHLDDEKGRYMEAISVYKPDTVAVVSEFAKCNQKYAGSGLGHFFLNGEIKYTGTFRRWIPILKAGSEVGIGRFTSYGFGTYVIHVL
jgi:hypothetical protein